jgi:DNA-binding GntR family transcriptional regulator
MHALYAILGSMTVRAQLRELIVSGALAPGARVSEAELAAQLDVSRTPVREALARLDGEGLVQAAGRGVRVRTLSADELVAVYRVRAALEALAAETAAESQVAGEIAPAALNELDHLADQTDAATRAGDLESAAQLNRAFHRATIVLAANPVALELLDRLWDRIIVTTRSSLAAPARADEVDQEHRLLLACIRAGDATGAASAARDHVLATLEALR